MKIEELIQYTLRQVFHDNTLMFDKSRFAGGLTNYNYIMTIHDHDYVIRQPGGLTELMIDRYTEQLNNTLASKIGVNCDCLYFDSKSGIKISTYVPQSKNIAQVGPAIQKNIQIVSNLLKKVHAIPEQFPNRFDWYFELTKYECIIRNLQGDFFFDYIPLKKQLISFIQKNIRNQVYVPCHNDTVPENFIVNDHGNAFLIDWEYAGMNDPCWDIAAYILESKLPVEAIQYFIKEYFGHCSLTNSEDLKIKGCMLEQDLLWTVWALARHYNGDDFLDYCGMRYERFRKNIKALDVSLNYTLSEMVK